MIYLAGFIALWVIYKFCSVGAKDRQEDRNAAQEVIEGIPATTDDIDEVLVRLDEIEELIRGIK